MTQIHISIRKPKTGGLDPVTGVMRFRPVRRHFDAAKNLVIAASFDADLSETGELAADLAPPVPDRLDVVGDGGDDGLGHEGAGHGDGLLADRLEHVVDDAAGAKPVGLGPVLHVLDPGPFHARGAAVPFEERERRVAGGAFPFQDAFERGMSSIRARVCRRMKEQGHCSSEG